MNSSTFIKYLKGQFGYNSVEVSEAEEIFNGLSSYVGYELEPYEDDAIKLQEALLDFPQNYPQHANLFKAAKPHQWGFLRLLIIPGFILILLAAGQLFY